MTIAHKTGSLICGEELVYFNITYPLSCAICGKTFDADASCTDKYFTCNTCYNEAANDWIKGYCSRSPETDPIKLAITLMKSPKVKMHGPEHHFLVPAVLLTVYYNVLGEPDEKPPKLVHARKRAESLKVIAEHGGPRCCKRDTFLALQTAVGFIHHHFDTAILRTGPVECEFSELNKECLECACHLL